MTDSVDEARLFASIRLSPIAGVVTNPRLPDNPIVAINDAFHALTGYPENEIIGRNCRFLSGPETEPEGKEQLREAVRTERPVMVELLNYRRDGSSFRNAVMIAPIYGDDGRVVYYIGSQMDVSHGPQRDARIRNEESAARLASLTIRQRQVLQQMARGLRNKQIAAELGINEKTVKMHRAALLTRLGAATSADAVRVAVEGGL
jgi:hypothetical protein